MDSHSYIEVCNLCFCRVEDYDDIMRIFVEQTKLQQTPDLTDRPYFLAELIDRQNDRNHTAVCEVCRRFEAFSL